MARNRREFLKLAGVAGAGMALSPLLGCGNADPEAPGANSQDPPAGTFVLPPLGYAFDALEPDIDRETMEIHYTRHHQAYINNLNAALAGTTDFSGLSIDSVCSIVKPDQTAIRNNGGGHWNHSAFWKWISPGGSNVPTGSLEEAMLRSFGSLDAFFTEFSDAAKTRFGSGWAWLSLDENGGLFVSSTPNQDNPLMQKIVERPGQPILGIDVWEHAYYLKYQNRRADYIASFLKLINWDVVSAFYNSAGRK